MKHERAALRDDPGLGPLGGGQADAAFWDPTYLAEHAPPERTVPRGERLSRNELVAITNSYFDGLSARKGDLIVARARARRRLPRRRPDSGAP